MFGADAPALHAFERLRGCLLPSGTRLQQPLSDVNLEQLCQAYPELVLLAEQQAALLPSENSQPYEHLSKLACRRVYKDGT